MTQGWDRTGHVDLSPLKSGSEFEVHSAPERGCGASIWAGHFVHMSATE
jgi:hypothetical protein